MLNLNKLKGIIVTHKKKIGYVGFGLMLLAIPLTIVLAQQQQDLRQRAAALPTPTRPPMNNESSIASISLDKKSCPTGQFGGGSYRCITGKIGNFPNGCQTTSVLVQLASGLCSIISPTPTPPRLSPTRRPLTPTPTAPFKLSPTPRPLSPTATPIKQAYSCQPNSYIGGTFCSSSTSCYDVYCNATGNAIRTSTYSSTTCGFCKTYKCAPNSFIAGTYNDGRSFDIYCNSTGNATVKRYY